MNRLPQRKTEVHGLTNKVIEIRNRALPGQIQSPLGIFALISILPYLKAKFVVESLAEKYGLTMSSPATLQSKTSISAKPHTVWMWL